MKRNLTRTMMMLVSCMCVAVFALTGCSKISGSASQTEIKKEAHEFSASSLTTKANFATDIFADLFGGSSDTLTDATKSAATVLVYMNGSDLESGYGEATADITEMLGSGIGKNANVVIETLGTSKWQKYGIASNRSQRYIVSDYELELVDDNLGQLDTTATDTLADFIEWGVQNYPAERYFLIMWDHGAGPVWGFGYDEFQGDYAALTLDEIQAALQANADVHFDFIGMDCCLMSSLETCCVLAPFCDYAILSEDFEPGTGWYYCDWMSDLENDPALSTVDLGTTIVDTMVKKAEAYSSDTEATLALIDESVAPLLYSTWVAFAYENESSLLDVNYSQETIQRSRLSRPGHSWDSSWGSALDELLSGYGFGSSDSGYGTQGYDSGYGGSSWFAPYDFWGIDTSNVTMSDYYVTDIMAVASSIDSDAANALEAAVGNAIVHYRCSSNEVGMTGIGVTLPYGDAEFYDELVNVFTACGFDETYIEWLEAFVDARGTSNPYDYEQFDSNWYGWDFWQDDYDWQDWAWQNGDSWNDYESSGWYDTWYDDQTGQGYSSGSGSGWLSYFYQLLNYL